MWWEAAGAACDCDVIPAMQGLVFAAIAPHGDLAIPDACKPDERDLAAKTQQGMRELERRFMRSAAEVVVVLTPHNVHVEGTMAVVVAASMAGELEDAHESVRLTSPVDRPLALASRDAMRAAGVPVVGVSYGGNDPESAIFPMDWAVLIPLWYLGGRLDPPVPVVAIAPARDLLPEEHVRAGRAIADAAATSGKRVALIASADHSHTHQADGPYGYHDASRTFDDRVVELVERNELGELLEFDRRLIEDAKPDSWWQMLMLHGALGDGWRGELLCYEAPTYYGMLCAAYERR